MLRLTGAIHFRCGDYDFWFLWIGACDYRDRDNYFRVRFLRLRKRITCDRVYCEWSSAYYRMGSDISTPNFPFSTCSCFAFPLNETRDTTTWLWLSLSILLEFEKTIDIFFCLTLIRWPNNCFVVFKFIVSHGLFSQNWDKIFQK